MSVRETIARKLNSALKPETLEIIDESALHAGHAGAPEGGESHFRLRIVAARFGPLSRLERQRLIHTLLAQELSGRIHALSIEAAAPGE